MNEKMTNDLGDKRSFEERVFVRFDAFERRFDSIDKRFDTVDERLDKLESRSRDTKPIWERALKAIMDIGLEVGEIKTRVGAIETKVSVIETKVRSIETDIGVIKTDQRNIRNELVDVRRRLKHNVGARLDMIQTTITENRDDIRDAEERIRELESKLA